MSIPGGPGLNFGSGLGNVNMGSTSTPGMNYQSMMNVPGWDVFKKFLGEQGFDKFMQVLGNTINSEIGKEQQKAEKAIQNLKKAEEGEPTDAD
jgi:hypothetical protein